jgi:hypothetical protein
MEERKQPKDEPIEPVSDEQTSQIAGGAGECTTTVTVSADPSLVISSPSPADAFISIYEGAVDATSHVIERVANAVKES